MEPLSGTILAIGYLGDIVFAISGALTAARYRMDILGFAMIGTITGIGGGTARDLFLGRTVWWTQDPTELVLCIAVSLFTFFFLTNEFLRKKGMIWGDALGLAAFGVVGCHVALDFGSPMIVAIFMGMLTATGGGIIRDVLTNTQPLILSGQLYATAALAGALCYAMLSQLSMPEGVAEIISVTFAFALRAFAIIYDIRMGPPGELVRIGGRGNSGNS